MSAAMRPTEFIWNGAVGRAKHQRIEISFDRWPPALMPGRAISYLLFIPASGQFELIEGLQRRELRRDEKAEVFAWLKGFVAVGHEYFDRPARPASP
jgi:hypothetical protein